MPGHNSPGYLRVSSQCSAPPEVDVNFGTPQRTIEFFVRAEIVAGAATAASAAATITATACGPDLCESPARWPARSIALFSVGGALLLMAAGLAIHLLHGIPARLDKATLAAQSAAFDVDPLRDPCTRYATQGRGGECRFGQVRHRCVIHHAGDAAADSFGGAQQDGGTQRLAVIRAAVQHGVQRP